jgi:hypothetical protein
VPLVVPLAPDVTVIHPELLAAVQLHPLVVVTVNVPVVAAAPALGAVGVTVKAHWPAWVTVTVLPAMVSVPVRAVDPELARTV